MKQKAEIVLNCHICGKLVEKPRKLLLEYVRKGRAYCSVSCGRKYISHISTKTLRATNLRNSEKISERMKKNNPMADRRTVEKMRSTKRANGTLNVLPCERGGNGRVSETQEMLAVALGWGMEHAVTVGLGRGSGYPTCYKIDIANATLMVAVEVDGHSHQGEKAKMRDMKKQKFLESRGWRVLRFTNKQVKEDLRSCVEKVLSTI